MSKIVEKYLKLKEKNANKLYLFKSGNFYIFIGDDAKTINDYMVLKETKFSNEYNKCGFPKEKLEQYLRVFKNDKLDIEVIEEFKIGEYLSKIDLDNISYEKAIEVLKTIRDNYEE